MKRYISLIPSSNSHFDIRFPVFFSVLLKSFHFVLTVKTKFLINLALNFDVK